MNSFKNKIKILLILFSIFMLLVQIMPVSAIEATGTVGQVFTWSIIDDVMEFKYINQEHSLRTDNGGNCCIEGEKMEVNERISYDDFFTDENETMIR